MSGEQDQHMPVTHDISDRVATVTLSRPERRNAVDHNTLDELRHAIGVVAASDARCVVLTGTDGHFCAGADLKELEDLRFTEDLRVVLDDLAALPVPTIAAIAGSCMGLGMQLAVACDIRMATPEARFAVPVAKLGLMVDHWTIRRVAALAGTSMARWMVLTAEPVSAERLHGVGFVQELVPAEGDPGAAVLDAASALAGRIAALAPLSLRGSKLGCDLLEVGDGSDAAGDYRTAFEVAWASGDLVEGRRAFGERRTPEFRGD